MAHGARLHFFSLPLEIREQIYTEVLSIEKNRIDVLEDFSSAEPPPAGMLDSEWPRKRSRSNITVGLCRVNKQIYHEATAVLNRTNTFVCIQSPFPDTESNMEEKAGLLILASGDAAKDFKNCRMKCIIDAPEMVVRDCCRFIITPQDLEPFTKLWFYYDIHHDAMLNAHLNLNLALTQELTLNMQERLILPFSRVKGLHSLTVSGPHSTTIEANLREAMSVPYDTPNHCLNECTRLKDAGNAALKSGNERHALKLYFDAFLAIHIVIDGRRRQVWADTLFESYMRDGPYKGKWGGLVRMMLRVQLVANVMLAYNKLGQYEEAYFWGMRSINLMRNSFEDEDDAPQQGFPAYDAVAKIYHRAALAARKLGKSDAARDLIRIAARWLPNDPIVQADNASFGVRMLG